MSYARAIEMFRENQEILGHPAGNEYWWNISAGLVELSHALETDMAQIRHTLAELQQRVK